MSAIITNALRYFKAVSFLSSLGNVPLYIGIAKSTPWSSSDATGATDDSPAPAVDLWEGKDKRELLAIKRIDSLNVTQVIPRVNWGNWRTTPASQKYSYWGETSSDPNYVLTSDYNVYKCLTRAGAGNSSIMPTHTTPTPVTLGDGYEWQYMYSIPAIEAIKNLTEDWIPVKRVNSQLDEITNSNQWSVQQAAIPGQVMGFKILSGGTGYSNQTGLSILGSGSNATVNITTSGGVITTVTVTNRGSGYTTATLNVPTGSGFTYEPILSPVRGHGSDPVSELGAKYVLIRTSINYDEGDGDFPVINEYRKILLIANPLLADGADAIQSTYDCTFKLVVSNSSNVLLDDLVTDAVTGASGYVVENDTATNKLKIASKAGTFVNGHAVNVTTNGSNQRQLTLVSQLDPEINIDSGEIIYKDFRRPIVRSKDRREKLDIVLEF